MTAADWLQLLFDLCYNFAGWRHDEIYTDLHS